MHIFFNGVFELCPWWGNNLIASISVSEAKF